MSKIRTFIAVSVTERINHNLSRLIERLALVGRDYRWVEPENLHLTLNFLGDLPDREVPEFCCEVKQIVQCHAPFDMLLKGVGSFPHSDQPRTIWIGVDQGIQALTDLYRDLRIVCDRWCANKDRNDFVPHLTLGRLRRDGQWTEALLTELQNLQTFQAGSSHVDRVIVFSSYLERSGPTHTPMATIKLTG